MAGMFSHQDALAALGNNLPVGQKLAVIHRAVKRRFPFVDRIAVATYDPAAKVLKTFSDSSGGDRPLQHYQTSLVEAPVLQRILSFRRPRVVNDISLFAAGTREHTRRIREGGYRSSYTMPLSLGGSFWGFVFFNSRRSHCFTAAVLRELDVFGHLVSGVVTHEFVLMRVLLGSLKTASDMVHARDPETGAHLQRMAGFARVIAQELAADGAYGFDDEFVERVFLFAPLHDVGKIGIPDRILLKEGRLTPTEFGVMKTHAAKGARIIDSLIRNFQLDTLPHVKALRNIAGHHHEALDGSGYPARLRGSAIPIEARIVAVADVFDALTSKRSYKEPWPNDQAFATLREMARAKLDRQCVAALIRRRSEVEKIQELFREEASGKRARRRR